MKEEDKTKEQLMNELVEMRRRITELETIETQLWESEKKYKTLTENSLTGIFIHQDGKYVFVNDRFAEIHGYKPEELLGKEYLTLIHPDDREALRQIALKRLKGEAVPQRCEVRRLRKDGMTIWCEVMATSIQYRGRPAIMGNIIDITRRKWAEEELKARFDKLELFMKVAPRLEERIIKLKKEIKKLKAELENCKAKPEVPLL